MVTVDELRAESVYPHPSEDFSPDCKKAEVGYFVKLKCKHLELFTFY